MACVETDKYGEQCMQREMHKSDHFTDNSRWPATENSCARQVGDNGRCYRDDRHEGECRPDGWIAPTTKNISKNIWHGVDPEYALWAGAVIAMFVAIGQLAAERAERSKQDSRFNWIEVD